MSTSPSPLPFPTELLAEILEDATPSTLVAICLASKALLTISRPLLYRSVTIRLCEETSDAYKETGSEGNADSTPRQISHWWINRDYKLWLSLRRSPILAGLVKSITLEAEGQGNYTELAAPVVRDLFGRCQALTRFSFSPGSTWVDEEVLGWAAAYGTRCSQQETAELEDLTFAIAGAGGLSFLDQLPRLRTLHISNFDSHSDDFDDYRPSFPFHLVSLRLQRPVLSESVLLAILNTSLSTLTTLALPGSCLEHAKIAKRFRKFGALRSVELYIASDQKPSDLPSILRTLSVIPCLQHLTLAFSDIYKFCFGPVDGAVSSELLGYLPSTLQSLALQAMYMRRDDLLVFLDSKRCPGLRLVRLDLLAALEGELEADERRQEIVDLARGKGVELRFE